MNAAVIWESINFKDGQLSYLRRLPTWTNFWNVLVLTESWIVLFRTILYKVPKL